MDDEQVKARIGANIAYYRKRAGLTQAGLAEKLNYSDKSISKWERGDGTPDVFILAKIADLYDITVQDLLREKKVPRSRSRHILIHLLSVGLVWLVMTVLFCISKIFHVLPDYAWMVFIYGIPVTGIVSVVFSGLWWNRLWVNLSCSLIIWGTGLSLVLSFQVESVTLLLIICAVVQVLLTLLFVLLHLKKPAV